MNRIGKRMAKGDGGAFRRFMGLEHSMLCGDGGIVKIPIRKRFLVK